MRARRRAAARAPRTAGAPAAKKAARPPAARARRTAATRVPPARAERGDGGTCQADIQTDPANCGRCGKGCAGGECIQGSCQPVLVLDAQEEPYTPGLDGYATLVSQGKIYEWEYTTTNATHYVVQSASTTPANPASTGTPIQDVPSDPSIDAVAFDSTYIYEAIQEAAGVAGEVSRKKLDGSESKGAATKMFSLPADLKWENIAVATDAVYVTGTTMLNSPLHPVPDTTTFYRMALPVTNPSATPASIIANRTDTIGDLAIIGNHLFWLESYGLVDWRLTTMPVTGGTPVEIDKDVLASTASIATDGTYVYWTTISDAGELRRCPLANLGSAHATHVADVASAQEGIIIQGQYVYVMELVDRNTFRINKDTGAKELLGRMSIPSPSEKGTRVIGVDTGFVYMTTRDAKVWRFPSVP